jgi:hypothetical protein
MQFSNESHMFFADALDAFAFVFLVLYAWMVVLPAKTATPPEVMMLFGHPIGRFVMVTVSALCVQYGFLLTGVALGLYVLLCQRDLEA